MRENKGEDLLVITPYKAQLDILSEMTRDNKLRIKTIDTVQGTKRRVLSYPWVATKDKVSSTDRE